MSKRKWRREQRGVGGNPTAYARAEAAIRAGNVQEAERWARLAERLAKAPPPPVEVNEEEERVAALRRFGEKLAEFRRDEEEREAVARDYDRFWWESGWNEIRAKSGLDPLAIEPPLHESYIRWAQAHPKVDFVTRTLRRYRERGYLPPAEGDEEVTEE